ncbi:MAG: helix-turn-helix transcriptional regulator [Myxococcota bacterium]
MSRGGAGGKEVLVHQIRIAMERVGIGKAEMARRMGTSRAALERLLDPENGSIALGTLFRAAAALGSELRVELRPRRGAQRRG